MSAKFNEIKVKTVIIQKNKDITKYYDEIRFKCAFMRVAMHLLYSRRTDLGAFDNWNVTNVNVKMSSII